MEWFHCNKCFIRHGSTFAVSTCGHICCEACIKSAIAAKCVICGTNCQYIPITDKMKPQDKMFFMDPVELLISRLERILQITNFQRMQMERTLAYFKHKSVELEKRLKEVTQQSYRQIAEMKRLNADLKSQNMELQREIAELKKPLSQRGTPSPFQTNRVRRISLPVAVTPPVTAQSRTMSPLGPTWPRNRESWINHFFV
ncbi:RING finger protein 212B-like isoform X2 [Syngnathus scovelli]|uniref:RING finger protein 212B-like isoform X2 n=1 Tax=Syngnathus scovelli TaxID=161590 RepID=UPI00210FCFB5|nr:RING finger protein 212B-like isoform X2 [Syngnathus scovelli]